MDPTITTPRPYRWKREEFFQMLDMGWFHDRRVELIDGEVLEMPAQKDYHGAAITLTMDALRLAFGRGFWVRNQMTLDLSPHSVPDPDLAVVSGSPHGVTTATATPTSALLVVEVAETTLAYDRGHKAPLYAAGSIADYWIVNLVPLQPPHHSRSARYRVAPGRAAVPHHRGGFVTVVVE
jgi:Uma2 family endonuclease